MNPFVNPNKRSVTLPPGCKDLIDVLNGKKNGREKKIRQFIYVVLFQAHLDQATELVIGKASARGNTPIRYKVKDVWTKMVPFPSHIRRGVLLELVQMAKFPPKQVQAEAVLDFRCGSCRSRWILEMPDPDDECRLIRVPDEGQPA